MNVHSAIAEAQKALEHQAFGEAENLLLPFAKVNSVEAQSLLGSVYQLQGNFGSVIFWLQKAAEAGNGCAAHNLGVVYLTSPEGNPEEAQKWLQLAHDLGFEAKVATDPLWFRE